MQILQAQRERELKLLLFYLDLAIHDTDTWMSQLHLTWIINTTIHTNIKYLKTGLWHSKIHYKGLLPSIGWSDSCEKQTNLAFPSLTMFPIFQIRFAKYPQTSNEWASILLFRKYSTRVYRLVFFTFKRINLLLFIITRIIQKLHCSYIYDRHASFSFIVLQNDFIFLEGWPRSISIFFSLLHVMFEGN